MGLATGMISPVGVLAGTAALGTPIAAQKALWSPAGKNYFTRGLLNTSPLMNESAKALSRGTGAGLLVGAN